MVTFNRILCLFIIAVIIGFTTPADATQRLKYTGIARSTGGAVLGSATVTIYLAGTTTPADVYEASSGGTSVNEVTTDSNGRWTFYADTTDYAFTQEYKVVVTKDGYSTITLDNIFNLSLPTDAAGSLINDGAGAYSWGTPTLASTATALAANPDPCAAGSYVSDIAADGELTCANPLDTPTFILADDGELPLPAALPEVDSFFKITSDGTMSFVAISDYSGIPSYGELTTEHVAVWYNDDGTWKLKAGDLPATDNSTASHWLYKDSDGHIENAVISTGLTDTSGTLTVTGMKSAGSTGQISITGPAAGQNRVKTVRDANDTLVEAGGNNTLTGANTIGDGGDDQIIKLYKNATNAKWSGTVMDFTCHETIALGQPVVINGDGEVALANADTPATLLPAIGIAVVGGNAAATCTVLLHGSVTVTAWAWTPGAIIYVDDSAAGALTATVGDIGAGNGVQRIGVAIHADSILVMPSLTVTVLE
jgi:hypothetical protein